MKHDGQNGQVSRRTRTVTSEIIHSCESTSGSFLAFRRHLVVRALKLATTNYFCLAGFANLPLFSGFSDVNHFGEK